MKIKFEMINDNFAICNEFSATLMKGILLLLLLPCIAFGQSKYIATAPLQFLKMGGGPRQEAMAGAYVGLADDENAVLLNPAGLANIKGKRLGMFHKAGLAGIGLESISYTHHFEESPAGFGANLLFLHSPKIARTIDTTSKVDDFSCYDVALTLGYGREVSPDLLLGSTLRLIREKLDDKSANTACFDLGLLFDTGLPGLSLGMGLSNIGKGIKFISKNEDLPITLRGGASLKLLENTLIISSQIDKSIDSPIIARLGIEHKVLDKLYLRAGYSNGQDIGSGISLGMGINIRNILADISFSPYGDLGNITNLSLCFSFLPEE
ncbi:MAG: PorV/PorQ family protein [bacterium]|nr:PorV/PorQ family protein [bacterium]